MDGPLIIVFMLLTSAFFSGMEIAFISSNRLKVEMERAKGTLNGKLLGTFYKNEAHFIATLLVGNNFALVIYGISIAKGLNPTIVGWGIPESNDFTILLIQTIISTLLVLGTAEFLPKVLVQINPNKFLSVSSIPMLLIYWILYVPTLFVMFLSNGLLKLFKTDGTIEKKVFSKIDLEHYLEDISTRNKREEEFGNEMQILKNALDFSNIKARDCMVPRTEILAVEINDSMEELLELFTKMRLSKVIVYRTNIDNVIGYVRSFEMFKNPQSIKSILQPISFVPEAIPCNELLEMFTTQNNNIAVVVDEYGGTSGMITLEDVIEQIFGEIEDEHDTDELLEEQISDSEFLFSARTEINYINQTFEIELDESDEYGTLGGLILYHLETIPPAGTRLEFDNYEFIIEEVSDRKIEVVRLLKK
jgi:putative hemolysin